LGTDPKLLSYPGGEDCQNKSECVPVLTAVTIKLSSAGK
jgi:hypothetical protein